MGRRIFGPPPFLFAGARVRQADGGPIITANRTTEAVAS